MKTIVLSKEDQHQLQILLDHECAGPWLEPDRAAVLKDLLRGAVVSDDETVLREHVGLEDLVSLVCPGDRDDSFALRIVTPHDADVDADRVSLAMPVALAALGRKRGEVVGWATPRGPREMRIESVEKSGNLAPAR